MDNVAKMNLIRTESITLNVHTARMLLEMLSKSAVTGADARHLAELYERAERAHKALSSEA